MPNAQAVKTSVFAFVHQVALHGRTQMLTATVAEYFFSIDGEKLTY